MKSYIQTKHETTITHVKEVHPFYTFQFNHKSSRKLLVINGKYDIIIIETYLKITSLTIFDHCFNNFTDFLKYFWDTIQNRVIPCWICLEKKMDNTSCFIHIDKPQAYVLRISNQPVELGPVHTIIHLIISLHESF